MMTYIGVGTGVIGYITIKLIEIISEIKYALARPLILVSKIILRNLKVSEKSDHCAVSRKKDIGKRGQCTPLSVARSHLEEHW